MGNKNKQNKGMSTQSSSKQKPATPGQTSPHNAQLSVNSASDVLSQSRNIIYGQDGSHLPHIEQQGCFMDTSMNSNVYPRMPRPSSTQMNSAQMNPIQGQPTGVQYNQGHMNMNNDQSVNNGPNSSSSIPQWAAVMCQQLQNIQLQLETQDKRWQSVEGQLYNQNIRMTQIETQINQLNTMSQKMSETTTKVNKIDSEVGSVKNKINEYSESVNYYNDICDNILGKKHRI